jgi:hypothetical protein
MVVDTVVDHTATVVVVDTATVVADAKNLHAMIVVVVPTRLLE